MTDDRRLTIGFPRMYNEPGERRAFLPPLMGLLAETGVDVYVETGCGAGMGYSDDDYVAQSPRVHIVDEATAYAQDIVVVLRAPEGATSSLRPGAILFSMLHFTTRPERVELLRTWASRRSRSTWSPVTTDAAWSRTCARWPATGWPPPSTPWSGAGRPSCRTPARRSPSPSSAGRWQDAIEWAAKAGDEARNARSCARACPGSRSWWPSRTWRATRPTSRHRLALTDILVDATARRDTSRPIFPNAWLDLLPEHAIVCDLAVDPYLLDDDPPVVRGIEGIPRATWTSGSSARTIRPGTACPRRSRRDTGGRSSPATRGRACSPSPAWRPTGRRSRR